MSAIWTFLVDCFKQQCAVFAFFIVGASLALSLHLAMPTKEEYEERMKSDGLLIRFGSGMR